MDKELFRYMCRTKSMNFSDIAKLIGVNDSTLSRKMSGQSDFTRNEIQMIRDRLSLDMETVEKIFFAA